jgi:hypothetical protein
MRSAFFYYTVIQLCFIIWKLTGVLNVAWWIVLLPTLGPIGVLALVVLVAMAHGAKFEMRLPYFLKT